MNAQIIAACEAFSMGDAQPALPFLADEVEWHIVGDRTIDGNAAVKEMCADAASQGTPKFQNGRLIQAKNHLIVEGADLESDMHYCDIYTIENGQIAEITYYSLAGAATGEENDL
jgi:ketosteroid isomerase-like protein